MSVSDEALAFAGMAEIARGIARKAISPVEVVGLFLSRIEKLNPHLNAYIRVMDSARREARAAEEELAKQAKRGLLHGVPISIKDLILTRGTPTTAGSKIFGEGLASRRDAALVRRLRRAGAILIAKANLHEVAFGVTNDNAHFGPARNPWDPERVPGGSSGGSAVAVAAGLCCGSIGTDTRGSIRIPSACCGITGLKPTLGLVPTEGIIPLSWTLDHAGPMTRTAEDAAWMLQALTSDREDYLAALEVPARSLRLGICEYYLRDLEPEVEQAVLRAIEVFRDAGLEVREVSIRHLEEALHASDIISRAEAVTYHDRCLREQPESYGAAVRERLESGYQVSGMDYVKACQVRRRMIEEFKKVFKTVDCLIGAGLPTFPPPIGQNYVQVRGREEFIVQCFVRLNAPQNVAGIPALTLPCGFSQAGLPIGLQLIAAARRESVLLRLGHFFQQLTPWHQRRPALE